RPARVPRRSRGNFAAATAPRTRWMNVLDDRAHEQLFTGTARLADGGLTEGPPKPLHDPVLPTWQLKKKEGSHELETIRRRRDGCNHTRGRGRPHQLVRAPVLDRRRDRRAGGKRDECGGGA